MKDGPMTSKLSYGMKLKITMTSTFFILWMGLLTLLALVVKIGHIQPLKILSPIVNKRQLYQQKVEILKKDGSLLGQGVSLPIVKELLVVKMPNL